MLNNSHYIPVDLAKKLLDYGMPLKCYITYDGSPSFDIPSPGEPGWADGNRYGIPTYAEVFDWFAVAKNIIITLEPFFTFALNGNIAFTWKISYPDTNLGGLVIKQEGDKDIWNGGGYGGSFKLTANAAIEYAMTITAPEQFVEVNVDEL